LPRLRAGKPRAGRRRCRLPALRRGAAPAQARQHRPDLGFAVGRVHPVYIPANVLPIMRTVSLGDIDDNTIISGVVELWVKGSPSLAVIVFTASIVVPMTKFLVLGTLLLATRRRSRWALRQRARLYRAVEFIGYWSMLDVFVVALLTALVRFGFFSQVEPLPGVVFFGLTVILTMFSSMSFDPRLMWDGPDDD